MTIAAVDESAAKAKVSKVERKVKMENLATGFKSDHAHHMNKITEEKTKAAEQLQTDQKVVSQGSTLKTSNVLNVKSTFLGCFPT